MTELSEQADSISESLTELEKIIRVPPETTGIVYDADKLANKIGMAQFYVGSSIGVPTSTAKTYVDIAKAATSEVIASINEFLGGELQEYRAAVEAAGIGLLADVKTVEIN